MKLKDVTLSEAKGGILIEVSPISGALFPGEIKNSNPDPELIKALAIVENSRGLRKIPETHTSFSSQIRTPVVTGKAAAGKGIVPLRDEELLELLPDAMRVINSRLLR